MLVWKTDFDHDLENMSSFFAICKRACECCAEACSEPVLPYACGRAEDRSGVRSINSFPLPRHAHCSEHIHAICHSPPKGPDFYPPTQMNTTQTHPFYASHCSCGSQITLLKRDKKKSVRVNIKLHSSHYNNCSQ